MLLLLLLLIFLLLHGEGGRKGRLKIFL